MINLNDIVAEGQAAVDEALLTFRDVHHISPDTSDAPEALITLLITISGYAEALVKLGAPQFADNARALIETLATKIHEKMTRAGLTPGRLVVPSSESLPAPTQTQPRKES